MYKIFKNKKGLTLIELLVTLLLVSIIVVFIYRLILNMNNQTTNPEFAMSNQTIRTEIIRTIESDLVSHDIDKILLVYQDEENNYNPSVYFYEEEKSGVVSILDEQAIQYKSFNNEVQTWELVDCYVNFDSSEKGESSGIVIDSSGVGNSTSSVSLNIVISNDNDHNSGLTSEKNNLKDDILISYLGHNNNLRFCSKESSHKAEDCKKYVLVYLDYNYPHKDTETLVSTDQTVGQPIDLPTDLNTDGYTFEGWFHSKSGGEQVQPNKIVTLSDENMTLYAHWRANGYTVTFDSNGGINPVPKTKPVTFDQKYGDLATTTRRGYTFVGWYMGKESSSQQVTKNSYVKKSMNHTLYARWRANTYTVTFNKNGSDHNPTPASKEVTYDEVYGTLATIERTGYSFQGWFTEANGGTQVTASTKVQIIENQTLYAHWKANSYTLTYDANGGTTPSPSTKSVTFDAKYGDLPTTTRTGYTFLGWYTTKDGGTQVTKDTQIKTAKNHTIYAHWKANNYTITLTSSLATQNGTPASVTATYDSASLSSGITNPQRIYTITFSAGSSGATLSKTSATSTWTFTGWWTAQTGGSKVIGTDGKLVANVSGYTNGSGKWVKASNVTLYAQWSGGTITPATATRTGYSCTLGTVTNPPTANKTYTATCTANKYTVTFNGNSCGTPNPTSKQVTYDAKYGDLATISKTGYTQKGWWTAASGGTQVTKDTTVKITGAQTLYAHCTANTYTITLTSTNATTAGTASVTATYDSANLSSGITNPKRVYTITFSAGSSGASFSPSSVTSTWTFTGWWTAQTGGSKVIGTDGKLIANVSGYTNGSKQWIKAGGATLYAQWSGGTITAPTPTRTGYTCSFGSITSPATANKTYTATCTANTYTVTFNGNSCGTPSPASKSVTYNSTYGTLASISKTGYRFDGWYTAASGGSQVTTGTTVQITSAQTLYAHCTNLCTATTQTCTTAWNAWSACSKSCGTGTQTRTGTTTCKDGFGTGYVCSTTAASGSQNCNTQTCCSSTSVSSYGSWGACSKSCGTGSQSRTVYYKSNYDGSSCGSSTETQSCNTQGCCTSTSVSSYGNWGSCSKSCGTGTRSRTVYYKSNYDGSSCGSSTESQNCNTQGCCTSTSTSYGNWGSCSASCGGGTQSRAVYYTSNYDGSSCGSTTESTSCNTQSCCVLGAGGDRCSNWTGHECGTNAHWVVSSTFYRDNPSCCNTCGRHIVYRHTCVCD